MFQFNAQKEVKRSFWLSVQNWWDGCYNIT